MRELYSSAAVSPASWSPASTIQHFGGDEKLVRELIALFLKSCPRLLDNLRARLRENDLTALGRAAHALKGSISNFTAGGPAATALELERLCGLGRRDAAAEMLQRLEHEMSRLMSAMRAFQEGAPICES
jgi:two-component system, sensor histidine kinase and response regulator